jgi:hypothetical protein
MYGQLYIFAVYLITSIVFKYQISLKKHVMSNLILSIEMLFCDLFKDVSNSLSGTYSKKDKDVQKLIDELYDQKIPTAKNDRANLKKDASNVANDYKKAFEIKNQEI